MGFLRDTGSALTMGISATTKHKEAEASYRERETQHMQLVAVFNDTYRRAGEGIGRLDGAYQAARDVLISSGAMMVDAAGNIDFGWYEPVDAVRRAIPDGNLAQSVIGSLPAFGIAVGAPALTWTLVGAFGTAATGTAISTLSGAAVGAATAAWIGRAATFGLAGATAGRFALGPIALLSLPVQVGIGAKIAGIKERRAIQQYQAATDEMTRREGIMAEFKQSLMEQDRRSHLVHENISRHTVQLETDEPDSQQAQDAAANLDVDMRQAVELLQAFAETSTRMEEQLPPAAGGSDDH